MANFTYTPAKAEIAKGNIDFVNDDIRVALVMTNTTADTEEDTALMNGFTTLDEFDGANYARIALASQAVNQDDANDRAEFDANDITFSALGAGTRNAQAAIVYKHVTDDTDSIPIAYIDTGGFPFAPNGNDVVVEWNGEGILQVT